MKKDNNRIIKVGVVGVGRGESFVKSSKDAGMELVALCDIWEEKLNELGNKYGVFTYTDYDKFLEHDMDAVILANYFHEHTTFAIKALEAGKHVMSETSCNATLAEGVLLCRAVEKSGLIYMLAENYAYTVFSQEMKRLYQKDEIGRVAYADGEYNHPLSPDRRLLISPGRYHWRNWIPPTYYSTHALAPLMYITDTMPVKINALAIPCREVDEKTARVADAGSVILCRMDNDAVFKLFGVTLPGDSKWYRLHGSRGAMELTRGPGYYGPGQIRIWHEEWDMNANEVSERTYVPDFTHDSELALKTGHGGGDFFVDYHFANAIKNETQPYLDVYKGVAMSSVGILAWKSALNDGCAFTVPDFKDETDRKKYENDNWSPLPYYDNKDRPAPSILGAIEPSKETMEHAYKLWKEVGYKGI